MSFIEGYAIGLAMIIFVGPVFFLLLNSSIQSGTKAGVAVALGIVFSDIICVGLCWYGLSAFINMQQNQFWFGVIGSVILLVLGISYLVKKAIIINDSSINSKRIHSFFWKGFSVNFFNPFVFAVWIGIYEYGAAKYDFIALFLFLAAVLLGILTIDLLKVFLSKKIKKYISTQKLDIFFKITGLILIFFSFRLFYLVW